MMQAQACRAPAGPRPAFAAAPLRRGPRRAALQSAAASQKETTTTTKEMMQLQACRAPAGHRAAFAAGPLRRHPRRAALRPAAASQKEKTTTKQEDLGWRFDKGMQRWVQDDRWIGKSVTTVQPLSGAAYTVWPVMWEYLNRKGLKQVDEEEALALVQKGAVIVDVRLASDYENEHIKGALSVPMFRITAGDDKWDKIKRFVMGSLFMKATERDPDFIRNFEATIKNKRAQIIVACAVGGTLDTIVRVESTGKQAKDPDRSFGRETRSLKACYELMQAGYTNVIHLKGGLSSWRYNGYPTASGPEPGN